MSYPKHGQFIDAAGQVKCLKCKWILSKCKCGGAMGIIDGKTASNQEVYLTLWLKVATKGNVYWANILGSDNTRINFGCIVCGSTLVANFDGLYTIPADVQEFVKFHRHELMFAPVEVYTPTLGHTVTLGVAYPQGSRGLAAPNPVAAPRAPKTGRRFR